MRVLESTGLSPLYFSFSAIKDKKLILRHKILVHWSLGEGQWVKKPFEG
jgi:hypothetical protein